MIMVSNFDESRREFRTVKKSVAIILLVLFTAQSFYSATIYIWFQVNRDYITKAFCVNLARPELKCGGQCYLAKQLQQAENNHPPQQLKEWVEMPPFIVTIEEDLPANPGMEPMQYGSAQAAYTHLHTSGIFRPPLA
jgi:hypothetical protein